MSNFIDGQTLVFYLREARSKAIAAAKLEALCVLKALKPDLLRGGPLADRGGVFWLRVPPESDDPGIIDFSRLGYTEAVDLVVPVSAGKYKESRSDITRFKGKLQRLERLYERDSVAERERDPDQRPFHLATSDGVREVRGYRGDGTTFGRRALPVCDAQLVVNIVYPATGGTLLDPFAGAGGIIQEAIRTNLTALSVDIDPILAPGLERMGSQHKVADSTALPIADESVDAIATELPFSTETCSWLLQAFGEMFRVLRAGGRLSIYCAEWQAPYLRSYSETFKFESLLDVPIDRKGSPCHVLAWEKKTW